MADLDRSSRDTLARLHSLALGARGDGPLEAGERKVDVISLSEAVRAAQAADVETTKNALLGGLVIGFLLCGCFASLIVWAFSC